MPRLGFLVFLVAAALPQLAFACPLGETLYQGVCYKVGQAVPTHHGCPPPLVANSLGHCDCPTGKVLHSGYCVPAPTVSGGCVPGASSVHKSNQIATAPQSCN